MSKDLIIACDFPKAAQTFQFLDLFNEEKPFVKIGMELFYGEGPSIVREVKARGHKVFLDLKLHDIPNTVGRAMKNLALLGVDLTNVHVAGGTAMMKAALDGLQAGTKEKRPLLIAVTVLTSISERVLREELSVSGSLEDVVASYAKLASAAGLDGVVCSPWESQKVKQHCGDSFVTVTPGIRLPASGEDDQSRAATPAQAAKEKSDYIVVGRPITTAPDPVLTYRQMLAEFLHDKSGG